MALWIAIVLFGAYVADVFIGATAGGSFLNDVQEMLVLFAASIAFVAAILRRERLAREQQSKSQQ